MQPKLPNFCCALGGLEFWPANVADSHICTRYLPHDLFKRMAHEEVIYLDLLDRVLQVHDILKAVVTEHGHCVVDGRLD